MEYKANSDSLGNLQKITLISISLILIIILFVLRLQFTLDKPLTQLSRNSIEPQEAFTNGNPTVLEFYADWCESCKAMAPNMLISEKNYHNKINLVMMNVDNNVWQDFIDKYDVKGIPQLNFFDDNGDLKGREIGFRTNEQIDRLFSSLLEGRDLNEVSKSLGLTNLEIQSSIVSNPNEIRKDIEPRSHG